MRWYLKPEPEVGQVRFVRKFLWWPLKIKNEIRWLEFAYIRQQYCTFYEGPSDWVNKEFGK